jgi:hypothetical protein
MEQNNIEEKINSIAQAIDTLALAVKQGFDAVDKQFADMGVQLKVIKQDVEDVKLRQDNVAYRFELRELQGRVMKLEDKILRR